MRIWYSLTVYRRLAEFTAAQTEVAEEPDEVKLTSNGINGTDATEEHATNQEPLFRSAPNDDANSRKRKADDAVLDSPNSSISKKNKTVPRYHDYLLEHPKGSFSMFLKEGFRERFCRCPSCYPKLSKFPQLLEEEESYEPPISESGEEDGQSVGTGSLLDRGEAALSNVDRVRAIGMCCFPMTCEWSYVEKENDVRMRLIYFALGLAEGVMVYNHLKDKVKSFLQPFAESGQAVGAEDIKAYFEKLRGDDSEQGMQAGAVLSGDGGGGEGGDQRREQSGKRAASTTLVGTSADHDTSRLLDLD